MWYIFNKTSSDYTRTVNLDSISGYSRGYADLTDDEPFGIIISCTAMIIKIWYDNEDAREQDYAVLDNHFKPINLSDGENLQ